MSRPLHPLLQRAYPALVAGQLDDAEALVRQVLAAAPQDPAALSLLARTLHLAGRLDEAAAAGRVDFEFDGEMGVDVALDVQRKLYPFCRLSAAANVLVMPGLHASDISTRLVQRFGAATSIGPLLIGLEKPVQIVDMDATASDLVQMALMAAHACAPKLL